MSITEILTIIATTLGGLALFLFGMNTLSQSLSEMTDSVLDRLMGAVTKNRFTAFLFATGLTAVVQSSSAVSVLTVGLVNSGIIQLHHALGLLIGGALGSTATAWLLSLNAVDGYSLLLMIIKPKFFAPFMGVVGVGISMFAKSEKLLNLGNALLGFSVMMMGMAMMGQGVEPLKDLPFLRSALMSFSNPIIGFLFAVVFTMLIQSSDATVGIVQVFALVVGVTFGTAIPLICGAQVGTCVTALISSLGASNNGKRTAIMNLYYALLRVIPFMALFYAADAIWHFSFLGDNVGGIGIPLCHTLINILGAAVWIPCGNLIIFLAEHTIPYSEEEKQAQANVLTMLDKNLLGNTHIALKQTDRAVCALAVTVEDTMQSVFRFEAEPGGGEEQVTDLEILLDRIRQYRDQIDNYITKLSVSSANQKETAFVMLLTNANTAFGEIGDICETFRGYLAKLNSEEYADRFTDRDRLEARVLGDSIREILGLTIVGYETKDSRLSGTIRIYREEVTQLSDFLKLRRYRRLHDEDNRPVATTIYADITCNLERLIDYCDVVADSLIKYDRSKDGRGKKSRSKGADPGAAPGAVLALAAPNPVEEANKVRQRIHGLFMDKYNLLDIEEDAEGHLYDRSE